MTHLHAAAVTPSGASPAALALYERALTQYRSYVGDPVATIEQALETAPDFVRGHVLRAMVLMTFSEHRFAERARVSVSSAEALLPRANESERELRIRCFHPR